MGHGHGHDRGGRAVLFVSHPVSKIRSSIPQIGESTICGRNAPTLRNPPDRVYKTPPDRRICLIDTKFSRRQGAFRLQKGLRDQMSIRTPRNVAANKRPWPSPPQTVYKYLCTLPNPSAGCRRVCIIHFSQRLRPETFSLRISGGMFSERRGRHNDLQKYLPGAARHATLTGSWE
jgi:hypothetical protein